MSVFKHFDYVMDFAYQYNSKWKLQKLQSNKQKRFHHPYFIKQWFTSPLIFLENSVVRYLFVFLKYSRILVTLSDPLASPISLKKINYLTSSVHGQCTLIFKFKILKQQLSFSSAV